MPRSACSRVVTYLIGVVLGICGPLAMVTPTGAQAPVAEAPTFQVGDEWRYTDGTVLRVLAIEGDLIVTTSDVASDARDCPDCRYYLDKNLTPVKVVDKNGKPLDESEIGYKRLDFPLQVGKQWSSNKKLKSASTGRYRDYENTFKVEEYGEVQTKAGTFKAFKITQTQTVAPRWSGRLTFWYSPEAKAVVKREVPDARWTHDRELEAYILK